MSDKRHFVLQPEPHPSRKLAAAQCALQPDGAHVLFDPDPSRTLEQNCYQWPYLEGFSQQLLWPVNGEKVKMSREEWKDVLTCAFEEDVKPRLAMGLDGGVVMLGKRTSKFGKKKFAEWMTFLMAVADLRGITPVFKNGEFKKWEANHD